MDAEGPLNSPSVGLLGLVGGSHRAQRFALDFFAKAKKADIDKLVAYECFLDGRSAAVGVPSQRDWSVRFIRRKRAMVFFFVSRSAFGRNWFFDINL
ncbi:hypothetical protein M514_07327 [Trichuris suis]|uniref:Uncharacterized protein n=1 Tax=Trichuris suis TaxID=68888 RepID=A0A085M3K4_9BILA|nr:hypothetical protein M513_07327 [Trichuris suis]KFD68341.1 hypothetical protein M514_07327 [Trichuris suis]